MNDRPPLPDDAAFRVGIYIEDLRPGGVTRYAINLAESLARLGHTAVILADDGSASEPLTSAPVTVIGGESIPRRVRGLRRAFARERLDVVISNGWFADAMVAIASRTSRRPPKVVSVTHISPSLWGMSRSTGIARAVKRRLARWAYDRADLRIAVSRGLADEMNAQGWSRGVFAPVYSPALSAQVVASRKPAEEGVIRPGVHMVGMGWLVPNKGFDVLLGAAALLRERMPVRVTIVGGESPSHPGYRAVLDALAARLGITESVTFAGVLQNPFPVLAEGDVFVFPSRSETFGLALIEAMAIGLPVVASDCPFGPREILDGGRYGMLVPVGDPNALAEAVSALALDRGRAQEYQRLGLERADQFSNDTAGRNYSRMIASLLNVPEAAHG